MSYSDLTIDDAFGNWLAGFVDGEGCFMGRIVQRKEPRSVNCQCKFAIELRQDDRPILEEIRSRLGGIGGIADRRVSRHSSPRQNPGVQFYVHAWRDFFHVLLPLFDQHPLRAKKKNDYVIWREMVKLGYGINQGGCGAGSRPWTAAEVQRFTYLRDMLRTGRQYNGIVGELPTPLPDPQLHLSFAAFKD